eukprot:370931-Rhodomonas_salina.1
MRWTLAGALPEHVDKQQPLGQRSHVIVHRPWNPSNLCHPQPGLPTNGRVRGEKTGSGCGGEMEEDAGVERGAEIVSCDRRCQEAPQPLPIPEGRRPDLLAVG